MLKLLMTASTLAVACRATGSGRCDVDCVKWCYHAYPSVECYSRCNCHNDDIFRQLLPHEQMMIELAERYQEIEGNSSLNSQATTLAAASQAASETSSGSSTSSTTATQAGSATSDSGSSSGLPSTGSSSRSSVEADQIDPAL